MHNCTGEDLYYKWEAIRFNRGPAQPFSLKDLQEVKAKINRDMMKNAMTKKLMKSSLSGPQSRQFGMSPARGSRPAVGSAGSPGTPLKPARRQDGFDITRMQDVKAPVAGPSRVTFVGPATGEAAYKKRACEWAQVGIYKCAGGAVR